MLDDVVALSKMAAASLDDVTAQAAKAGSKAAGIVIDDAAVTPRYVVGLASARELPIIWKIAVGSLKNKLLFLLPGALALSYYAEFLITPLLMFGGGFLCMEGFHKAAEFFGYDHSPAAVTNQPSQQQSPEQIEDQRVASAIRTDFILSAEIMAITLAGAVGQPVWKQAVILAVVGIGMTVLVYGAVALIVKADDVGLAMAKSGSAFARGLGRAVVAGMPKFLKALSTLGMLAMLWVGGGIIIHGLKELGLPAPEDTIHHLAEAVGNLVPIATTALTWLASATLSAVVGLVIGAAVDKAVSPFITSH